MSRESLGNTIRQARLYADPVAMFEQGIGGPADEWQSEFLRTVSCNLFNASKFALLCTRQSGKSTVCAGLALWTAIRYPKSTIIIISPTQKQSGEMVQRIRMLSEDQSPPVPWKGESKLYLNHPNGSRILCVSGSGSRGTTPRLVLIDEACFLQEEEIIWPAVLPSVAASRGAIVALTSAGVRGTFFEQQWEDPNSVFKKTVVSADMCPRITKEFIEQQRCLMTRQQFEAEFENKFVSPHGMGALFSQDDLDAILARSEDAGVPEGDEDWDAIYRALDTPFDDLLDDDD